MTLHSFLATRTRLADDGEREGALAGGGHNMQMLRKRETLFIHIRLRYAAF